MNVVQGLGLARKWGPHVISAVYLIESLFGPGMSGAEKKEAVMTWLRQQQEKLNLPWGEQVIIVISNMIDTVVGILNLLGVFRHKSEEDQDVVVAAVDVASAVNGSGRANMNAVIEKDPELSAFLAKLER